jgi:predicted nucleic acid-binding protein
VILLDSSIFIGWMRRGINPLDMLRRPLHANELVSCGVVRCEVLRGAIKPKAQVELNALFDVVPEIPTTAKIWQQTAELAWELDRKGIVLPLPDLVVAACALSMEATVITMDTHFAKIPKLKIRREVESRVT